MLGDPQHLYHVVGHGSKHNRGSCSNHCNKLCLDDVLLPVRPTLDTHCLGPWVNASCRLAHLAWTPYSLLRKTKANGTLLRQSTCLYPGYRSKRSKSPCWGQRIYQLGSHGKPHQRSRLSSWTCILGHRHTPMLVLGILERRRSPPGRDPPVITVTQL